MNNKANKNNTDSQKHKRKIGMEGNAPSQDKTERQKSMITNPNIITKIITLTGRVNVKGCDYRCDSMSSEAEDNDGNDPELLSSVTDESTLRGDRGDCETVSRDSCTGDTTD